MRLAFVFALLGSAAQAQVQDMPWPETVTTALFSDADFTTPRPADEIAQNWALLTEEDRATVRADCAAANEQTAEAVRAACEALPQE